jgi:glycosyltransferase involved in cell wall biosynthesis
LAGAPSLRQGGCPDRPRGSRLSQAQYDDRTSTIGRRTVTGRGAFISEPLVSIGLPTYNGERYIREALDALLAQDYPNLRLLISDNASTDRTAEICLEVAARDERVSYRRSTENIGAARNFNETFALTTGEFFMWAADDDRWHPSYVRRCVAALEADRGAVMATTGLRFIDESGAVIEQDYTLSDNPDLSSDSVAERVGILIRRGGWYQSYGVIRREALARTQLFRDAYGPDVIVVLELALQGRIVKIGDVLFWYRQFSSRTEVSRAKRQGRIADEDRVLRAKYTYLQESLSEAIRQADLSWRLKAILIADVLRAAYVDDTPLNQHIRGEIGVRRRLAISDRDPAAFLKFASLGVAREVAQAGRRVRRLAVGRPR